MKPSSAFSSPLPPEPLSPRWSDRRRTWAWPLAVALCGVLGMGCVLPGTHAEVVDERDTLTLRSRELSERVKLLEASNESLSGERVQLIEEVEDLRTERDTLDTQVGELTARRDQLESELAARDELVESEQREVVRLRSTYDGLVEDLQAEVAAGRIEVEQLRQGVRVRLAQEVLFPKGSARVADDARAMLRKVAGRLVGEDQCVEVHGHTDDLTIGGRLARIYPSNWELAGARASAVLRLLEGYGVPPERMTAVSFGPHRPVASNETAEGRAQNRRIEIRLVPAERDAPVEAEPAVEAAPEPPAGSELPDPSP